MIFIIQKRDTVETASPLAMKTHTQKKLLKTFFLELQRWHQC
jgi:hypothetical protein